MAFSAVLLLGGCGAVPGPASGIGTTHVYRCADEFRFVTRTEPQRVWLFLSDLTTSLPQVPAASGVHYTDGRITLRVTGEDASLELNGRWHRGCVNQPDEAIWEDAKLRGVDFRAVGNEPGWSLEIDDTQSIIVVTDHGASRVFPAAKPKVDPETRSATYESEATGKSDATGRRIRVVVEARECRDRMNGESFPASVIAWLDGRTYHGCGRSLP